MVSFILELAARWQGLDTWFKFRVKKKYVIQDLGVRIHTVFINRDSLLEFGRQAWLIIKWDLHLFSQSPLNARFLHNFTRSRSGWTKELLSFISWSADETMSNSVTNQKSIAECIHTSIIILDTWSLDWSKTEEANINIYKITTRVA